MKYAELSLIVTFNGQDVKPQKNMLSGEYDTLLYSANYLKEQPTLTFQFWKISTVSMVFSYSRRKWHMSFPLSISTI